MKDKIIVAVVTCLLTLVGNFALQRFIQEKAKPLLVKDVYRTDLSGLPKEVQQQIPLVPIKYSLQHKSGAAAHNVTILIKNDGLLSMTDLKFSPESEDHQFSVVDPHTFKIDIPTIRPNGLVSFQIIVPVTSQITITELAESGQFVTAKELETQKQKTSIYEIAMVVSGVALWLAFVSWIGVLIWKVGKWWRDNGTAATPDELKSRMIFLITVLFIYEIATGSLGPLSAFLPVPHISFSEIIDAFILYFLVTRYKLIEEWLSTKRTNNSTSDKTRKE